MYVPEWDAWKAFQNRSDFFDGYSPDTLLGAMMTCNGCKSINPKEPDVDEGILENRQAGQRKEIKVMHVGACRLDREKKSAHELPKSVR